MSDTNAAEEQQEPRRREDMDLNKPFLTCQGPADQIGLGTAKVIHRSGGSGRHAS